MVATTGKDPPGRTPRATKRQNTAAETKERHVQLLNKLSNRHHLYLLRDSAALNRYVALSERNAVEPREDGGSATPNPDLGRSGCTDGEGDCVDHDRAGDGGGGTSDAQEGSCHAANADRIPVLADAKRPDAPKPQKKRAAKYRAKLTTSDMEVKSKGVYSAGQKYVSMTISQIFTLIFSGLP
ncbi:hypothetical protein DVH05_011646 [Phytophthora capsici]|nr:hypothetical protein DVH05_011646 [Phytophthora capsici]